MGLRFRVEDLGLRMVYGLGFGVKVGVERFRV